MKSEALRILLLADAGSFHTERFAKELKRQDCHVVTASLETGTMRYIRLKRLGPVKSFHYLLAVPQIGSLIKRFRPDVINAHYASGYGFVAARAMGKRDVPMVLNLWGSDVLIVPRKSTQGRIKTRTALERADFIIGDSRYLVNNAAEITKLKSSMVIPWGIEREYLRFHKTNYALNTPLRVIVPRRHEVVYNNTFIIESLKPLLERGDVRLTFPNFGSLVDDFKRRTATLPESSLHLYDRCERCEFLSLMSEHDVSLSASRSDSSPASLIEAMALGLIPVAADIEGVREWLTAESGFRFEQDNSESLYDLVAQMTYDGDSQEEMRLRNIERVKKEAIFENNVTQQIEIMTRLVGSRH